MVRLLSDLGSRLFPRHEPLCHHWQMFTKAVQATYSEAVPISRGRHFWFPLKEQYLRANDTLEGRTAAMRTAADDTEEILIEPRKLPERPFAPIENADELPDDDDMVFRDKRDGTSGNGSPRIECARACASGG